MRLVFVVLFVLLCSVGALKIDFIRNTDNIQIETQWNDRIPKYPISASDKVSIIHRMPNIASSVQMLSIDNSKSPSVLKWITVTTTNLCQSSNPKFSIDNILDNLASHRQRPYIYVNKTWIDESRCSQISASCIYGILSKDTGVFPLDISTIQFYNWETVPYSILNGYWFIDLQQTSHNPKTMSFKWIQNWNQSSYIVLYDGAQTFSLNNWNPTMKNSFIQNVDQFELLFEKDCV